MAKKYVSNKDVSVRIFRSGVLEWFTHVHPAVPHVLYIPLILVMTQKPLSFIHEIGLEPQPTASATYSGCTPAAPLVTKPPKMPAAVIIATVDEP